MGKRDGNKFERVSRDYYATIDPAAATALRPHILQGVKYIEPCAGNGDLVNLLSGFAVCVGGYDIEPQQNWITKKNCLEISNSDLAFRGVDYFITNPPYTWSMLKPLLDHLPRLLPTWMLLPADYMHNIRMGPYMKNCDKVVSVGRLYWQDNKIKGVDNYAWYLFDENVSGQTLFYGRR